MLPAAESALTVLPRQKPAPAQQRGQQRTLGPVGQLAEVHPVPACGPMLNPALRQEAAGQAARPLVPAEPAFSRRPAPARHAHHQAALPS
eukprot:1138337-Prorocentrum_lima.AAC.1